jgi:hypothetical protein
MRADCVQTCKDCKDCILAVIDFRQPRTELEPIKVKPGAGRAWSLDLMGGFPKTKRGNRLFTVAVERMTR